MSGRAVVSDVRGGGAVPSRATGGFSLIELLVVVLIVSILAAIAQPRVQRALVKARAAEVVGALKVVDVAVRGYEADRNTWPPDRSVGEIPAGLGPYLPDGFSFVSADYTLDYDNLSGNEMGFVGVTVVTGERNLGLAVMELLGSNTWTNGTDHFTWVLEWE